MNILITGASSGIGKSLVEHLTKKGNIVWGIGRRKESFPIRNFTYSSRDVQDIRQLKSLKTKMDKSGFHPDVIILAAGIFNNDLSPSFSIEKFKETFNVNLFGGLNVISLFLPEFLRKRSGQFIALSSISAFRPNKNGIAYPSSKSALSLAFRGLDLEYRKKGVCFSNIYLGPVNTSMWEGKKSFLVITPEKAAKLISKTIKTKKSNSYLPFLSTSLFKISRIIPDKLYSYLSENFIK